MDSRHNSLVYSTSCINPKWSVAVYQDYDFPKSAGYFMHETNMPETVFTPEEVKQLAGKEVMQELTHLGIFIAWG